MQQYVDEFGFVAIDNCCSIEMRKTLESSSVITRIRIGQLDNMFEVVIMRYIAYFSCQIMKAVVNNIGRALCCPKKRSQAPLSRLGPDAERSILQASADGRRMTRARAVHANIEQPQLQANVRVQLEVEHARHVGAYNVVVRVRGQYNGPVSFITTSSFIFSRTRVNKVAK